MKAQPNLYPPGPANAHPRPQRAGIVTCAFCRGPVPPEFTPAALEVDTGGIAWCSGTCCRRTYQDAILQLVKAALSDDDYARLTREAEMPPLPPASLPELTTANHIRQAIDQVTSGLLSGRVTPKQCSLVLYALQTALGVLKHEATTRPTAPEPQHHPVGFSADEPENEGTPCSTAIPANANSTPAAPNSTAHSSAPSASTAAPSSSPKPPRGKKDTTRPTDQRWRVAWARAKDSAQASPKTASPKRDRK